MKQRKRLLTSILCGIFVVLLLLSGVWIATHMQHECPGEGCPVCATLSAWEHLLRSMALAAALKCALPPVQHSPGFSMAAGLGDRAVHTLVTLKVKLSD